MLISSYHAYLHGILCKCTSASVSVSVVIVAGTLFYHAYLQLNKTRQFTSIKNSLLAKLPNRQRGIPLAAEDMPLMHKNVPTTTTVDLREEHKNSKI